MFIRGGPLIIWGSVHGANFRKRNVFLGDLPAKVTEEFFYNMVLQGRCQKDFSLGLN